MKFKGLAALVVMTAVVGMVVGGTTLFAQQPKGEQPSFGQIEESKGAAAQEASVAQKTYGYAIERGTYSVQVKAAGKGMICYRVPPQPDRFYSNVDLKYLRYSSTSGGFQGPYYEAKAGNHTFRVLFSYNTDVYGRYYVFYANTSDQITASFVALSRCEAH